MTNTFALDPTIDANSYHLVNLSLSQLRLYNDARFPWLLIIPQVSNVREVFDLSYDQYQVLTREIYYVAGMFNNLLGADKINIATLGNKVSQLHIHIIARYTTDVAWPSCVFSSGSSVAYSAEEKDQFMEKICDAFLEYSRNKR